MLKRQLVKLSTLECYGFCATSLIAEMIIDLWTPRQRWKTCISASSSSRSLSSFPNSVAMWPLCLFRSWDVWSHQVFQERLQLQDPRALEFVWITRKLSHSQSPLHQRPQIWILRLTLSGEPGGGLWNTHWCSTSVQLSTGVSLSFIKMLNITKLYMYTVKSKQFPTALQVTFMCSP